MRRADVQAFAEGLLIGAVAVAGSAAFCLAFNAAVAALCNMVLALAGVAQ